MIEWALRSGILILVGALLLKALRIKDASIRLAAWTALLFGSLAIPAMTTALPALPVHVTKSVGSVAPAAAVAVEKSQVKDTSVAEGSGGVGDLVARPVGRSVLIVNQRNSPLGIDQTIDTGES
jgi:hypothetical protein